MSKTDDVARRFHEWVERYDHRDDTPSESFKTFIVADRCIVEHGVSYDEYKEVAEKVKSMGHGVDTEGHLRLVGRGRQKAHPRRMRMFAGEPSS